MKLRNLLMMFVITCSGLVFCACEDESEDIVPEPVNPAEVFASGGETAKDHGGMD